MFGICVMNVIILFYYGIFGGIVFKFFYFVFGLLFVVIVVIGLMMWIECCLYGNEG